MFKVNFFLKKSRNKIGVSNSLDPDQATRVFGPDLGPKCLQRLSADDTSRHRVNPKKVSITKKPSLASLKNSVDPDQTAPA